MNIAELVSTAGALLLDFDGPICDVFSGYPARHIASELRDWLAQPIVGPLDEDKNHENPATEYAKGRLVVPADVDGPHELYRWAATSRPDLAHKIDAALAAREEAAVFSAEPTPFAHDVIRAAAESGLPIAIASNNDAGAIHEYLHLHELKEISIVVGRPDGDPGGMKPNPQILFDAARALAVRPEGCIFVGDATTDMGAALHAGMAGIGYAKAPGRRDGLRVAGAAVVIDSMGELLPAIAGRP